ncbi:MAG: four helix bundle protein [Synergistaceae bacterium]|nr:four helix bundle protein [Synergistaceae bacterium]
MAEERLRILASVERMEAWLQKSLERAPKYIRFPVYAQMKASAREMRRLIIECNFAREKSPYFTKIDMEIALLKSDAHVMMESRLITPGEFKVWSEHISKVGSQLGAWIKAINAARNQKR